MSDFKTQFINTYGQSTWSTINEYFNKGLRSPEHREAAKLYVAMQRQTKTYTIYGIMHNGVLIYVGRTGVILTKRWYNHVSSARSKRSGKLYEYMSQHIDDLSSFSCIALETTNDPILADDLERSYINKYRDTLLNVNNGGGGNRRKDR